MSTRRFGLHTLAARSEHKRIKMAQTAAKAIAVESTAPIVPYLSGGGKGEGSWWLRNRGCCAAGSPGICATLIACLVILVIVVAHSTTTEHAERSIEAVLARVHARAIPAHADGA